MKNIRFHNVLPDPLKESPLNGNVWKTDLELLQGRKYLLQAASGKGKTTFLHILYGIRKDYTGDVFLKDNDIRKFSSDDVASLRASTFACLFQDLRLFGELTAEENIFIKPGNKYNNSQISEWATRLGVAELLKKPCQKLSFGQQQRIACIRALSQPFQWLLLDEPFSHLDRQNIEAMSELILQRCQEENAGLIVTSLGGNYGFHDFEELNI